MMLVNLREVTPNSPQNKLKKTKKTSVKHLEKDSIEGLSKKSDRKGFENSLLQNDKSKINQGKLINEAINQGLFAFSPDLMFSQIVKNFQLAEQLYGEKLIRLLTDYNPDYIKKNINIPEFQRELKYKINESCKKLEHEDLIKQDGEISDSGISLASIVLLMEELDGVLSKNIGNQKGKIKSCYGDKNAVRSFKSGDNYRNLAFKQSLKLSIRRKHPSILKGDLKTFERTNKSRIQVIYAIDASGSMKGKKIETAKKAGVALAFKAIQNKDEAGLVVFGSEIKHSEKPTRNLKKLLEKITQIRASKQTDFVKMLRKSIELFSNKKTTKHLIILTDAMPTVGDDPEESALESVSKAKALGISTSLIGINLDKKGVTFAKKLIQLSQGRLYLVKSLEEVGKIVLEDYYSIS